MSFRLMLCAMAAATIGLGGAASAARSAPTDLTDAQIEAEIDALIAAPGSEMMAEIRRLFPDEFGDFKKRMVAGYRRGDTSEEGSRMGVEFMSGFMTRHAPAIETAPIAQMMAVASANAALARTLQSEDTAACAAMVWGGALKLGGRTDLSAQARLGLAAYQRSLVAAMAAGEKSPTVHHKLGAAEGDALVRALVQVGAGKADGEIISRGGQGAPSPEASCAAGVFFVNAVTTLPPEMQAVFMAGQ